MRHARPVPRGVLVLPFLIIPLWCSGAVAVAAASGVDPTPLLERLGRVAWLYADTALRFSCRETITVDGGSPHRYDYIYTHDEKGRFRDYRTRPGRRSGREVDMRREQIRRWFGQAYSWVFIFRADRRERFRFAASEAGEVLARPALRLDFEPIPPIERDVNDWAGTVFIDRDATQILRVEAWSTDDFLERARFESALEAHRPAPPVFEPRLLPRSDPSPPPEGPEPRIFEVETIVTEFGAEKNGMRFPSEVRIDLRRYSVPGRRGRKFDTVPVYNVRQAYTDYRFFSVRTAEEISAMLSRSESPSP